MVGIDRELERAMRQARRDALRKLVRQHPELTLADLVRLARGRHGTTLAGLTIGDLIFDDGTRARALTPAPVNTRRPADRANFEQAILSTLDVASNWMSASEIRATVGGTPAQARAALTRLIEHGKVVFRGQARGTQYKSAP